MIEHEEEELHPGFESVLIGSIARFCCENARLISLLGIAIGLWALGFTLTHFSMDTNTDALIAKSLPWRVRESAFNRLFQPEGDQVAVVIDAKTPELADRAEREITGALRVKANLFAGVSEPGGGPFFEREGLLFEPLPQVQGEVNRLVAAQPLIGPVAADPSLRGVMAALSTVLQGVQTGQASLSDLAGPMNALSTTIEQSLSGKVGLFSWRNLISGPSPPAELRRIVMATPKLNYASLSPARVATKFIHAEARRLGLTAQNGVSVRLTGAAPLADAELSSLGHGVGLIAVLALLAIIIMLWLATRTARLIWAILLTMLIGLSCAAALGLVIFGKFNVISVAFIPLFVGLGIDFGIQISVRYLACRREAQSDLAALTEAGRGMGRSISLAATAIAVGFFAFAPTDYVGVSQLGIIAGVGMFIALILNLTLLPAFITVLKPPVRGRMGPGHILQNLDRLVMGFRREVLGLAAVAAAVCVGLLPLLHFDFNPLHLQNPKAEPVATMRALMAAPNQSPDTVEIAEPNLADAQAMASRLERLPEVDQARTVADFVPADQGPKLAAIAGAGQLLDLTLNPIAIAPPPSDQETRASLTATAAALDGAAANGGPGSAEARRLGGDLTRLAAAPLARRQAAQGAILTPFETLLSQIRTSLSAQPVSLASLPPQLKRDWLAPNGEARVSVVPKGNSDDNRVLRRFILAVQHIAPHATGPAIDTFEGGRTVEIAFVEAGILSLIAVTVLLFLVLRNWRHVAITITPIILTGLLTLGSCVVIGESLNFANIIALPLLVGIGVAFHIYFVLSWRRGGTHLIHSSLTRAVFFSALATATGFGSLWVSSHPGTASMGRLLMISLIWTLVSALIFQPALMGPPPEEAESRHRPRPR